MAAERFEIRIAGSGGQGVILTTELISQAITYYEPELYVVQSQAYGPEARGGKSKAEVVISSEPIDYPKVIAPSLQVILTQAAADEFATDTKPGGRIVYDDFFVTDLPGVRTGEYGGGSVESTQARIDARIYVLPIVKKSTLAQIYKRRDENGGCYGGPAYYIETALKSRALGIIFAIISIPTIH